MTDSAVAAKAQTARKPRVLTGNHFMLGDHACAEGAIAAGLAHPGPAVVIARRSCQLLPEEKAKEHVAYQKGIFTLDHLWSSHIFKTHQLLQRNLCFCGCSYQDITNTLRIVP